MAKNQVTNRHAAITALHVLLDSGAYTTISHQQIYEKHWRVNIKLYDISTSTKHALDIQPLAVVAADDGLKLEGLDLGLKVAHATDYEQGCWSSL